jgi:YceI-like domain
MKKQIILLAIMAAGLGLMAQEEFRLAKSSVKMEGTSTLHDWTAEVEKVNGNGHLTFTNNTLSGIKSLNVTMTANSIKSSKGSTMDNNMYKAMKAKEYPSMTYSLTKVQSITQKGGIYYLETEGKLTIAGTAKTISMSVTGKLNGTEITFKGSKKLKMTDFKVEPPVMFLGTLKTDDNVTIAFETTFVNTSMTKK